VIKMLYAWRDNPALTPEQCEQHYRTVHMDLARTAFTGVEGFRSLRYNRVRRCSVNNFNQRIAEEITPDIDAFVELYFESADALARAFERPELQRLFDDHENFMAVDVPANVRIYDLDETVILEAESSPAADAVSQLSDLRTAGRVMIAASPATLYDMIADVTRMGEWSPVCKDCWWDEGASPAVGSWFTGRNVVGDREWERRCEVAAATPGKEFAFVNGGRAEGHVRWRYTFTPAPGGTEVEESWTILRLTPTLAELTTDQRRRLVERTRSGIEATLTALKRVAESR